jgi:hypothetical protein
MAQPTPPVASTRSEAAPPAWDASDPPSCRVELIVLGIELLLVAAAAIVGAALTHHDVPVHASAAPLIATWRPHLGPGSAVAFAVAALVVWRGGTVARAARWGPLLCAAYVASVGWTFGLALVDGWSRGVVGRLATVDEYPHDVPRVHGIGAMISTFSQHIIGTRPDHWTTQVAGHPPGAFLVFVGLDRIGLGGGAAAGVACILVGALAPMCVAVTLGALGSQYAARAALPFLVLFPGAVWVGSSADGVFLGVAAAGLALLAVTGWWRDLAGGLLLGYTIYLSYGLALIALLAVAILSRKSSGRWTSVAAATTGLVAVVVAFTMAGFWWLDGYRMVVQRYHHGYGGARPYEYWVWANLACLVISAGPAVGPSLRHALSSLSRTWRVLGPATLVALAAALALVAADLSGLSKGETERIWLPYSIWLLTATPLLPASQRRGWLALQAATALIVNHLLLTHW